MHARTFALRGMPAWVSVLLWLTVVIVGAARAEAGVKEKVADAVPIKAQPFDLRDVRLLDGPFKHAMELDRDYLLLLDPDRLLHDFRVNAGLPSTAKPLGGWEAPNCEVRGHFVGHYLSACSLMYASTGDAALKEKANAVVAGLAQCQAKLGDSGYLSAFPESFIDRVEAQKPVWAPYYTLHKILAGLLDTYVYCDNAQALEVARKFGDWFVARNSRLSDEQMQKMLGNEHGGVNEALANLYALTGEKKYLAMAMRFNHHAVIDPAVQEQDRLTGLHANTQIPKFIGTAREYELSGDASLATASGFFWSTVVHERSYVIGGHSDNEHFSPKEKLSTALGSNTTETCNTYNMLKLTRHLFSWDPRCEYADYYERALYNHILASQNPVTGMMCYYVPLRSGSHKGYNDPLNSFWCCTGTGVENHAKYGDSIYFHDPANKTLWINLFIASELKWKETGMTLRQETEYPDQPSTTLAFTCEKPVELTINIRHPAWATEGFSIRINGADAEKADSSSKPGEYASITRSWKSGDRIEITMPFSLHTEGFKDNPRRFAFLNGPLVLGAQVDTRKPLPVIVADGNELLHSLAPIQGKPSTFTTSGQTFRIPGEAAGAKLTLEPFYKLHGNHPYVVYWDSYTPAQWQAKQEQVKAEQARARELEARTVDVVIPTFEQMERDHKLQGERTGAGEFNARHWRHAMDGGWFSWQMKVAENAPQELVVSYWGSDGGNRVFDILVDGTKLATQRLESNKPDAFFDQAYLLPPELLAGKRSVTVKFQAHAGAWAGGVFEARIVRKENGGR